MANLSNLSTLNLSQLKKARAPIRSLVTRTARACDDQVGVETASLMDLEILQKKLVRLAEELAVFDNQVKEVLLDNEDTAEDVYTAEIESIDNYASMIESSLVRIERVLSASKVSEQGDSCSVFSARDEKKLWVKLPKLEIRKFSGEHLDWLTWWAQFAKIHKSDDLSDSDKFEYLEAAMKPNTRSYDIVHSYPMTNENYSKVIAALKARYAKPKVLKQLYV